MEKVKIANFMNEEGDDEARGLRKQEEHQRTRSPSTIRVLKENKTVLPYLLSLSIMNQKAGFMKPMF